MVLIIKFDNGEDKIYKNIKKYAEFDDKLIVYEKRVDYSLTHHIRKQHIILYCVKEDK